MKTSSAAAEQRSHPQSYYAATAHDAPERRPLTGRTSAAVGIVGAGFTGLNAGLELAAKGYQTVILEAARVGWGASGRNGGQVINGFSSDLDTIFKRYDPTVAHAIADLLLAGSKIIRDRIRTHAINCGLKDGCVTAALTTKQLRDLEKNTVLWRRHGYDTIEMLDASALRAHVVSDLYLGGCCDRAGGHLHPLNLVLGEAAAFEESGGVINERSAVLRVDDSSRKPVAITAHGELVCDKLLLCGNAYLGQGPAPKIGPRFLPVATHIIATEPLEAEQAARLMPSDMCIEDARVVLDYYRLSEDRRLLFGGEASYGGLVPTDIEGRLRPRMAKVFPELAAKRVEYSWSGNLALSLNRFPQLGRLSPNVYFAGGYSGHGLATSHLFGHLLAEAVDHQQDKLFELFANLPWIPFWGGNTLWGPLATMGAWWYSCRDALGL